MLLQSFEIKNFRSIKHIKCYTSPKITILAGKNESGKTTILEALTRFDTEFSEDDTPTFVRKNEPTIVEGKFVLSDDEAKDIMSEMGFEIDDYSNEVTVTTSSEYDYGFSGELYDKLKNTMEESAGEIRSSFNNIIDDMKKDTEHFGTIPLAGVESLKSEAVTQTSNQINSMQAQLIKSPTLWGGKITKDTLSASLNILEELTNSIHNLEKLDTAFQNKIPTIVFFDSFEDRLDSEVELTKVINEIKDDSKPNIIRDFVKLSGLDLDALQEDDRQHRIKATNMATKNSNEIFGKYWKQDPIVIEIRYDEPKLTFFIKDEGNEFPFKPEQRSKDSNGSCVFWHD